MSDEKQKKAPPVDLEQRAVKKWGTNTFVGMINRVPTISNRIHSALTTKLKEIENELDEIGESGADMFHINTEAAEAALLTGPKEKVLTKVLYRMSAFFSSMKMVSICHTQRGKKKIPSVRLHQEVGEGLRLAKSIDPLDLDPFNQYVFLHLLPFVQKEWRSRREQGDWKKYRKAVEEVVQVKVELLTTLEQDKAEEE